MATPDDLNRYAWTLLTCPPEELRDPSAALEYAKKASELSGEEDPNILDTLAYAHFKNGDIKRAVEIGEKALSLLPKEAPESLRTRQQIEAKLKEFRKAQKTNP